MSIASKSSGDTRIFWLKRWLPSPAETKLATKIVAVTGASGFIGRHLCTDLVRNGLSVRALTRAAIEPEPGMEVRQIRSLELEQLKHEFDGADVVIHLAGRAHMMSRRGNEDALYSAVNLAGTRAVADAAVAAGVPQILFTSSVKAIGEGGETVLRDDSPERPLDAYGKSKLAAERAL